MPLSYFDIYNDEVTLDDEGIELPDVEVARARAIGGARDLACDTVRRGHLVGHHRIEIMDADRKCVGTVRFDEAVEIRP